MPKFKVKSPLSHDGKEYKIGDPIDMSDEAAAPLLGHTLAMPGEDVAQKKPSQVAAAVDGEADRLAELHENLTAGQEQLVADRSALQADREQLANQQLDLQQAQEQLAAAQAELDAGVTKLAADRTEFEKNVAKANKK